MFCPRCGLQNDDVRAACWNCFGQLRTGADLKAAVKADSKSAKEDLKKAKKEKKGKKGEPVVEPVAEPVATPDVLVETAAPVAAAVVAAESVPFEMESSPTEVMSPPVDDLGSFTPETATAEPVSLDASSEPVSFDFPAEPESAAPFDFSAESADSSADDTFVAGISMGLDSEPAVADADDEIPFLAGSPLVDVTDIGDEDATPNDSRMMDLDAPLDDSSFVIPGLADDTLMADDSPEFGSMPDFGTSFDLDSEEPGKKTDLGDEK